MRSLPICNLSFFFRRNGAIRIWIKISHIPYWNKVSERLHDIKNLFLKVLVHQCILYVTFLPVLSNRFDFKLEFSLFSIFYRWFVHTINLFISIVSIVSINLLRRSDNEINYLNSTSLNIFKKIIETKKNN